MLWFPPGRDVVQGLATRKEGSVEVRPTTDKRERQWDGWMGDVVPVSLSLSLSLVPVHLGQPISPWDPSGRQTMP